MARLLALALLALCLAVPAAPLAAQQLDKTYFVGAWETHNVELGHDVRVVWTVREDGTLAYDFEVDGVASIGSTGTWDFRDGTLYEYWNRPDGSHGEGRAQIERIDDDHFKLTVIDNGAPDYRGLVRIYRRLGQRQLSLLRPR